MCDGPAVRRRRLVTFLLAGVLAAAAAAPAGASPDPTDADRALLRAADLYRAAPQELRARLRVTPEQPQGPPVDLEVFRSGDRVLVRFLDPRDRGKFLLRRGRDLYFLAPGSRRAIPLDPSHRLQGAVSLDEILGPRLEEDYRIASVSEEGGVVTFRLEAATGRAPYPVVRYAVDRDRELPLRADFLAGDDRVVRVVGFLSWRDPERLVPGEIRVTDPLRGRTVRVELLAVAPGSVAEGLFDLEDPAAREALGAEPVIPEEEGAGGSR
ncbi:MAG: outer membrane lipoprotein-sorting protein [Thermoanaerobaculia bacterium]